MTTSLFWYRFYTETPSDKKIKWVAENTHTPRPYVLGVWATMLSLARQSPVPGVLMLTKDHPLSIKDIAEECGATQSKVEQLCNAFETLGMVEQGTFIKILHWGERQFESDSSTERVRKYRNRNETLHETLPERDCNAPDTDTELNTDNNAISPVGEEDKNMNAEEYKQRIAAALERNLNKPPDKLSDYPADVVDVLRAFCDAHRYPEPFEKANWIKGARELKQLGFTPQMVTDAVIQAKNDKMTVKSPRSIAYIKDKRAEPEQVEEPTRVR